MTPIIFKPPAGFPAGPSAVLSMSGLPPRKVVIGEIFLYKKNKRTRQTEYQKTKQLKDIKEVIATAAAIIEGDF